MEVLPTTHQLLAQDPILLTSLVPNRQALEQILIVLADLHKMALIHLILELLQIHQVQQPEQRTEVETCLQRRRLNQLHRMLIQMLTEQ